MALLTGLDNNGKVIGAEGVSIPPRKYIEIPIKVEDTPSPGYVDISSIKTWKKHGLNLELNLNIDYGFVRGAIKELVIERGKATAISQTPVNDPSTITKSVGDRYIVGSSPIGDFADQHDEIAIVKSDLTWEFKDPEALGYHELNIEEKLIAIEYNIGDLDDHENDSSHDLTVSQVKRLNAEYHIEATENRYYRRRWVEALMHRELSAANRAQVGAELAYSAIGNMVVNYADYGIKGTVEDHSVSQPSPPPAICDYFLSREVFHAGATSPYVPGLSSKGWTTRTGTLNDLVQEIYNVLVFGVYL